MTTTASLGGDQFDHFRVLEGHVCCPRLAEKHNITESDLTTVLTTQDCFNNSRPPSTPVGMVVTRESEFSYSFGTPIPLLKARLVSSA